LGIAIARGLHHNESLGVKWTLEQNKLHATMKRIRFGPHNSEESIKGSFDQLATDAIRLFVSEQLLEELITLASGFVSGVSEDILLSL
jgi:hypothetical protein